MTEFDLSIAIARGFVIGGFILAAVGVTWRGYAAARINPGGPADRIAGLSLALAIFAGAFLVLY